MEQFNTLIDWFENLSRESLDFIGDYYQKDAFFKDPFNQLNSIEDIRKIFIHMFEKFDSPRFVFREKVIQGNQAFLVWDFNFNLNKKNYNIHGGSLIVLDEQSKKVKSHRDYWDVGEELLLKIPVVKNLYGIFRNRFKIT